MLVVHIVSVLEVSERWLRGTGGFSWITTGGRRVLLKKSRVCSGRGAAEGLLLRRRRLYKTLSTTTGSCWDDSVFVRDANGGCCC